MKMCKLEKILLNEGILIGSRAFNVHSLDSDYDYCVSVELYDRLIEEFKVNIIKGKASGDNKNLLYNIKSCKIEVDKKAFNLISYRKEDLLKITSAMVCMYTLERSLNFSSRSIRYLAFEKLLEIVFLEEFDEFSPVVL